jgi:hypothetical protein
MAAKTRSRKRSRWRQPRGVTSSLAALQLKEALWVTIPATLSAWKARRRSSQSPGTTSTGETQPSSEVISLSRSGWPRAWRAARSGPGGPHTMRSWVLSEPVMWISSTAGCRQRKAPSSPPPCTMASTPRSTAGRKASSSTGPR